MDERGGKFLQLFGLHEDFTEQELASAYRTLAKLNHPDVSRDTASEMRMIIINEGYGFLQEYRRNQPASSQGEKRPDDFHYTCYKTAFMVLKTAFEEYFGEGEDKSNTGDLILLKERLQVSKNGFSRLLDELPYSPWVDDAIDKINSINKWLV